MATQKEAKLNSVAYVPHAPLPEVVEQLKKPLNNDRVRAYRQAYRLFRTGQQHGAKGEVHQFRMHEGGDEHFPVEKEQLENETFFTLDSANSEIYEAVTNYRIHYAQFRQGAPQGARGEVTAVSSLMTVEHISRLPVGQQAGQVKAAKTKEPERPKTAFHLHFGGGRLGLGLLSPAIAKAHKEGIPYALVDAPFGDYEALVKNAYPAVTIHVNGEASMADIKLVTKEEQLPENLLDSNVRLFLCTTDTKLVAKVLAVATTISTSLGPIMPKVLVPHFENSKKAEKFIYCCENDHGMVEKLGETLEGKATVITCMVDRICPGRDVEKDQIYVTTEPHLGECVVLNPPKGAPLPAFSGDNILVPQSSAEAEYFCRRKISLVNGMHTTLAFMTLCKEEKGDVAGDHILMTHEAASDEEKTIIWHWAVARLLLVMYEHDLTVIKSAHHIKEDSEACQVMLDYGEKTLKRFNTIKDQTSRVLGGGVANRWSTRLRNVERYLDSQPNLGGIQAKLLRMAKVNEADMRKSVTKLVKEADRFVGQKPTWER